MKPTVPTEEQEQRALATWLDLMRVTWCHVPNGGHRHAAVAGKLRAAGVKAGVPDVLIFDRLECQDGDRPDAALVDRGVALELKRSKAKGVATGRVSEEQSRWHAALLVRGWIVLVAYGANDAIAQLTALGIGRK